jgi:hypothetical protein
LLVRLTPARVAIAKPEKRELRKLNMGLGKYCLIAKS